MTPQNFKNHLTALTPTYLPFTQKNFSPPLPKPLGL